MRNVVAIWVCVLVLGMTAGAAPGAVQKGAGEQFAGTWTGTWVAEASSGGIELTIEKGPDGALTGGVSVTGDPAYKAVFKSLTFDGAKMTANYDFTPDPALEVTLAGAFEGKAAKGTWSVQDKGGNPVATGTWSITRKE